MRQIFQSGKGAYLSLFRQMFVKYFIPEDGDEQNHPNIFRIENTQPSYSEIKSAFPVPGTYHFRFLKNVGSHIVWLDVTDDSSALPTHQGSIFIKATRISAPPGPVATSTGEFTPTPAATFAPAPNGAAAAAPSNVSPPAKAPKPVLEKRTSEKLLKFDDDVASPVNTSNADVFATGSVPIPAAAAAAPAPAASDNDLLGIGSSPSASNSKKASTSTNDFFGLETLQPTTQGPMSAGAGSGQHSTRSMSPMAGGPMNPLSGGHGMGGGMGMGGTMGAGMGMHQQGPMGGGMGGRGMGMGVPMGGQPARGPMGPGATGYDPFSSIGSMQGGRGAGGMGGRR